MNENNTDNQLKDTDIEKKEKEPDINLSLNTPPREPSNEIKKKGEETKEEEKKEEENKKEEEKKEEENKKEEEKKEEENKKEEEEDKAAPAGKQESLMEILTTRCKQDINIKTVTSESPSVLQEKYTGYEYYVPLSNNKKTFEIKDYLSNVKGSLFSVSDKSTPEEKQKIQTEINTQFFKDLPRIDLTVNNIKLLDLYNKYLKDSISSELQQKIKDATTKEEYFELLEPSLPKIKTISTEEKTAIFNLRETHLNLNLICFLPWFDNYILEKIEEFKSTSNIEPTLNDIKILSQQGVLADILALFNCYYVKILQNALCIDLTKNTYREITPFFITNLEINTETDFNLLCDIKVERNTLQWAWQKNFILMYPNNGFILSKIMGNIYIDWNTEAYILWKIKWIDKSIEDFFKLLQKIEQSKSNTKINENTLTDNKYTGGDNQQKIDYAIMDLVSDMEQFIFNKKFNEKFPKNLQAFVNYLSNTIKDTSNTETIQKYIQKVKNINKEIQKKINDNESTDDSIIDFEKLGDNTDDDSNINTQQNDDSSTPTPTPTPTPNNAPETTLQKMKKIGTQAKDNAVYLTSKVKDKARHITNAVGEGITKLSDTSNVSEKMVATNEAVTLGGIITSIALMAPLLAGGSKKRKNIKRKKYTKRRKNTKTKTKTKTRTKRTQKKQFIYKKIQKSRKRQTKKQKTKNENENEIVK